MDSCVSLLFVVVRCGWLLFVVVCCGSLWSVVVRGGWLLWVVVVCGSLWIVLVGCEAPPLGVARMAQGGRLRHSETADRPLLTAGISGALFKHG